MTLHAKMIAAGVAALIGAGVLCPVCGNGVSTATAQTIAVARQPGDTTTVKLHISGMTCGSCPLTARTALRRLHGVFDAKVVLDDSSGVVRYDPRKVTAPQIAEHLTRLTGYGAQIIVQRIDAGRRPGKDSTP
jgi:copper chaperone CopZ